MASLVSDWLVEELSLVLVNRVVRPTLHHDEVTLPTAGKFKVLFCRREGVRLAFLERHSRLLHNLLHILMGFLGKTFEIFDLGVLSRVDVSDAWQFIAAVCVLYAEARVRLFRRLVKVLAEELVQVGVVVACRHVETLVPLGNTTVVAISLVLLVRLLPH